MRNLIYHLKPRFYPPFELKEKTNKTDVEHFKVYIDESILYEQQDASMIAKRFIVAFYTIKANNIERLNRAYKQSIYANKSSNEKKSNQVSDKTNRRALKIAQNYLVNAAVLERSAYDYNQFGTWKKNMLLSLELLSYIQPIENILLRLKEYAKTAEIIVDVIIDRTSQNCIDPCLSLNEDLLKRLAKEISDPDKKISVNYQTADSKDSYGIQVADMFAGAYRKELSYHRNEPLVSLIPFPYHREILEPELQQNSDFLKILGQIVHEQMPQNILPAPQPIIENKPPVKNKREREWDYHPFVKLKTFFKKKYDNLYIGKDVFSEASALIHKLKSVNNAKKRMRILMLCWDLNKQLGNFAKRAGLKPHTFASTLSQKTDDKHYEKTLSNLQRNLNQLKNKYNDRFERRYVIRELRVFNKQIKKYC